MKAGDARSLLQKSPRESRFRLVNGCEEFWVGARRMRAGSKRARERHLLANEMEEAVFSARELVACVEAGALGGWGWRW